MRASPIAWVTSNGSTVPLPIPDGLHPFAFNAVAIPRQVVTLVIALQKQVHPVITELTCERLRRFQHFGDMAGHLDLVPGAAHDAVLVDQEGAAVDAHVSAAIHALLDPDAAALGHLA